MLVIHPHDQSTAMLSVLYHGLGAQVVTANCSGRQMGHLLHGVSSRECIMLLGHGSDRGLFYREDDGAEGFDKIIVGHSQAYLLRQHGLMLIGVWCHANLFAQAEGLHGLFSGMIISERHKAEEYGIEASPQEILASNQVMFGKLRGLLDRGVPLHEIPLRMSLLDEEHTALSKFNYGNFHYL